MIKPYPNNPRRNDKALEAVKYSIQRNGFRVPIILTKDYTIVAGHTRYKAMMQLGKTTIPATFTDMDIDQAREYRIADNKTAELSEWNDELLALELKATKDLSLMQPYYPDVDLELKINAEIGSTLPPVTDLDILNKEKVLTSKYKALSDAQMEEFIDLACPECGESFTIQRRDILTPLNVAKKDAG